MKRFCQACGYDISIDGAHHCSPLGKFIVKDAMITQTTCADCGKLLGDIHTCSPQVANTNDADREAFEAWHKSTHECHNYEITDHGSYDDWDLTISWNAYQAALLHARYEQALQALADQAQELDMGYGKAVPEWLPIESAPKDGTQILLCDKENEKSTLGWYVCAEEDSVDDMGSDAGFVDHEFSRYILGRSFGLPHYQRESVQPTHWMPLPLPPEKE